MNPQELAKLTLATSSMTDRQIIENIYGTILDMNGSLKSHGTQLRYVWALMGFVGTAMLTMVGLLVQHVIP